MKRKDNTLSVTTDITTNNTTITLKKKDLDLKKAETRELLLYYIISIDQPTFLGCDGNVLFVYPTTPWLHLNHHHPQSR